MHRSPTLDEVGGAALYLLSDLSGAVTGEVHFVDCGYSTIAMPNMVALKTIEGDKETEAVPDKAPREAAQ
jgi:enoyl-[acyl-carrier protein] reductase I